jgi:Fungal Zn(2)-Cys(6) binuclear cluster domain
MVESTPLRKRRRPALSCVECRRRKIKCDRNEPCNYCKRSPSITCVYGTPHSTYRTYLPSASSVSPSSAAFQHNQLPGKRRIKESSTILPVQMKNGFSDDSFSSNAPSTVDSTYSERECYPTAAPAVDSHGREQQDRIGLDKGRHAERDSTDPVTSTSRENRNVEVMMGINFCSANTSIIKEDIGKAIVRIKTRVQNDLASNTEPEEGLSSIRLFGQSHWKQCYAQVIDRSFQR